MAVTRTGSVTKISSSSNSGSQSITVQSDAELMVVGVGGASPSGLMNYFSGTPPTIGGNTMTLRRDDDNNGNAISQCIFTYTSPPTGSQTLAWDWSGTGAPLLGCYLWVAFYKGVDTSSPIGATGGAQDGDNSATTGSLTASSGDGVFAICSAYNPTSINWTNATEIDDGQFNGLTGSSAETFPSGNVTLTATQSGGSALGTTISAIVIKQSSGRSDTKSGSDTVTVGISEGTPALAGSSSQSDTVTVGLSESVTLAGSSSQSDTVTVGLSESVTLAGSSNQSDTVTVGLSESASVLVVVETVDTVATGIDDSASVDTGDILKSGSDTVTVGIGEGTPALAGSSSQSDTVTVGLSESVTLVGSSSQSDAATVGITDTVVVTVLHVVTDMLTVSLADTSSVTEADAPEIVAEWNAREYHQPTAAGQYPKVYTPKK